MHIAIEGMDGVGKTSQAKAVAKRLNCEFIAKSFHEMNDPSGKYDNFVTIQQYTDNEVKGQYGLRQNYFLKKIRGIDFVTDRFYISNYWSREADFSIQYFDDISMQWGVPDLMIILYAEPDILYKRIFDRNPKDKDLWKPKLAEHAYGLMQDFVKKRQFSVLVINTSNLEFDETTEIIMYAKENGIHLCRDKYEEVCSIIEPQFRYEKVKGGRLKIADNRLVACETSERTLFLPETITTIEEGAFCKACGLKELTISKSVVSISELAFDDSALERVDVDSRNDHFASVEGMLLDKSGTKLIRYFGNNEQVYIPEGVTTIGNRAFSNRNQIVTIVLPKTIQKIGFGAFVDCTKLMEVFFEGNDIRKISSGAFVGCNRLSKIVLSASNEYCVEDFCLKDKHKNVLFYFGVASKWLKYKVPSGKYIYPFAYFERLKAVELLIYDSVEKVGSFAFEGCAVDACSIGENICELGEKAFGGCDINAVYIKGKQVPDVWNNTFDVDASIYVRYSLFGQFIKHRNWKEYSLRTIKCGKSEDELCGTSCVRYILEQEDRIWEGKNNLYWIMELAMVLATELKESPQLFYKDSRLMRDYYLNQIPEGDGVKQILDSYFENGGVCVEKEIGFEELKVFFSQYRWVIVNLRSEILFNNEKLTGSNHYVILDTCENESVIIVCPGKTNLYKMVINAEILRKGLWENGQWVLCIGER